MIDADPSGVVPDEARRMIDGWAAAPAFIRDRYLTVVASNRLAEAVSPFFREGVNLPRAAFAASGVPAGLAASRQYIADTLKESVARFEWDAEFEELVNQLTVTSSRFADAWTRAAETAVEPQPIRVENAHVGPMCFTYEWLTVPGRSDLSLAVLRADDPSSRIAVARLAERSRSADF
ncbi:hypothetical protein GCM10027058_08250 [Microbacterium neimengense]